MQSKTDSKPVNLELTQVTGSLHDSMESAQASLDAVSTLGYFELEDVPVRNVDLIEELHKNLSHLEDLSQRISFQMRENRYLMKL